MQRTILNDSAYGRGSVLSALRENVADDPAGNIGQAIVPAVVKIGQPLMIKSEQVQDSGVQIVDVQPIDSCLGKCSAPIASWRRDVV